MMHFLVTITFRAAAETQMIVVVTDGCLGVKSQLILPALLFAFS